MENHLHISVDFALVAVPLFPQLCPDHFEEAAKLNGMAAIRLGGETDQLYELEAAYAGYGMGLCQDYMNSTSCRAEENNMSSSAILSILYTDTALMVDWYPLSKVRVQSRNSLTYRTDWTLGSLNVPRGGSQEVENYWQHVNTTIADTILNNPITTNGSQIDKLFLLGESSKHAKFKSVVQDTMLQLRPKLPVIFDDDVVYAAAKGAAETAKRAGDLAVLQRESERTEQ